ncbi:MAG: SRPBCC family protein [Gammaproteobacteria bacterium]|nr:SRPBCC family protein [Gammaproteobacteria bacterium]MDH5309865.1 SRPBCC family protein [Gammaproteobacteria bacterium]
MRKRFLLFTLAALGASCSALAEPNYYRLELDIAIDSPAAEVWARVGGYCDISEWAGLDCEITQGDGGIGTVRVLRGTVVEPMVAKTDLSYGYTQPVTEGEYYTLYHGFMEARPVTETTSRLIYTMMWDISQSSEMEARTTIERRRTFFTAALAKMKELAEAE